MRNPRRPRFPRAIISPPIPEDSRHDQRQCTSPRTASPIAGHRPWPWPNALPIGCARASPAGHGRAGAFPAAARRRASSNSLAREALDWSKVIVTLVDERWVPDSDTAFERAPGRSDTCCRRRRRAATFVPLYADAATPEDGLTEVDRPHRGAAPPVRRGGAGHGRRRSHRLVLSRRRSSGQALDPKTRPACCRCARTGAGEPRITLTPVGAVGYARRSTCWSAAKRSAACWPTRASDWAMREHYPVRSVLHPAAGPRRGLLVPVSARMACHEARDRYAEACCDLRARFDTMAGRPPAAGESRRHRSGPRQRSIYRNALMSNLHPVVAEVTERLRRTQPPITRTAYLAPHRCGRPQRPPARTPFLRQPRPRFRCLRRRRQGRAAQRPTREPGHRHRLQRHALGAPAVRALP